MVVKEGFYLAIISTVVETDKPMDELKPAFDLIGPVLETFVTVTDELEPINKKFEDGVVITSSFSSVSHFEHDILDILALYQTLTGKKLDLDSEDKEEQK